MSRRSARSLWAVMSAGVTLCALTLPATTALASQPRVVVAHAVALPRNVTVVDTPLTTSFDVVLVQRHRTELTSLLAAISNPASANYRHFLTTAQFAARFGASANSVNAVRSYFASYGLHPGALSKGHILLHVSGSTPAIAHALDTSLVTVRRANGSLAAQFSAPASVPATLAHDVSAVAGLTSVTPPASASAPRATAHTSAPGVCPSAGSSSTNAPNALGGYTLGQQALLYGLNSAYAQGFNGAGQTIGVYELGPYNVTDLHTYFNCYGENPAISDVAVDGGSTGPSSDEATLDIEEAAGLAPGAAIEVYSAPNSGAGPLDAYQQMADDNTASVITTSWGTCESDPSGSPQAEQGIFEQMAAQGQTVLAASGDNGSSDCAGVTNNALAVDDPASQPYVTGVGGLSVTGVSPLVQTVWNDGTGSHGGAAGGGLSTLWSRPSWQIATGITSTDTMRMVPDLSVMGDPGTGFIQYFGGWGAIGGTSIGSPLMSAVVAVAAQRCGQGRLGFINPALYAMAATGFIDVTTGNNDLFGLGEYSAGTGYDMASGLGSPNPTTFMGGLCPQASSPTMSTFTLSSDRPPVGGTPPSLSMVLRSAAGTPLSSALVAIAATRTNGVVLIDNDHSSEAPGGNAAYSITTDQNGAATVTFFASSAGPVDVTVSYQGKTIYSHTLHFVNKSASARPSAPRITKLTPLVAGFRLRVSAPTNRGSRAVTAYQYSINGGATWLNFSAASKVVTVNRLAKGRTYRVVVRALSAAGPGARSAPSSVRTLA
ncbi:MAG TPA: protease pro-enzyme activation domain-containing protein [Acidimicrobiales bacterium]|nr:protease pro-enzyme activation domain-containing protein [Acidimicrobiales bacterium]